MAGDGLGARDAVPARDTVLGLPVPPPRRGRGRRPSGDVRDDILNAAALLLLHEGTRGFTVERIAVLAGVSKMSVYKWWPSRGVLAIEAHAKNVDATLSLPDSGDIEVDLIEHLTGFVELLSETRIGRATAELLGAAQTDPELAEAFRTLYLEPRRAEGAATLRLARERGQIPADTDLEVVSDQLWGACMYRLMTGQRPLDGSFVGLLVRNLFAGIRARST